MSIRATLAVIGKALDAIPAWVCVAFVLLCALMACCSIALLIILFGAPCG